MAYKKVMQTKVVRTTHIVNFMEGQSAELLQRDLGRVPVGAILKEVCSKDLERVTLYELKFEQEESEGNLVS